MRQLGRKELKQINGGMTIYPWPYPWWWIPYPRPVPPIYAEK